MTLHPTPPPLFLGVWFGRLKERLQIVCLYITVRGGGGSNNGAAALEVMGGQGGEGGMSGLEDSGGGGRSVLKKD